MTSNSGSLASRLLLHEGLTNSVVQMPGSCNILGLDFGKVLKETLSIMCTTHDPHAGAGLEVIGSLYATDATKRCGRSTFSEDGCWASSESSRKHESQL